MSNEYVPGDNAQTVRIKILNALLAGGGGGGSCPLPINTVAPTISGDPRQYSVLIANGGTWLNGPVDFSYQWQISDNGTTGWSNIFAATSSTYTVAGGDLDKYIRVIVTATNANGSASAPSLAAGPVLELDIAAGLQAYWKMNDDGDGLLSLLDSSGNSNNLTNTNEVSLGAGIIDGGASFTYGPQRLNAELGTYSTFSFSMWAKGGEQYEPYPQLLNADGIEINFSHISGPNKFRTTCLGNELIGTTTVTDDAWHYCVITFDGETLKLFTDGVLEASASASGSQGLSYLCMGVAADDNPVLQFYGNMDEVAIWNRALVNAEIVALYNNGNGMEISI